MHIYKTKTDIRGLRAKYHAKSESVGLVPTMGYLHDGHMKLVRRAKEECERVITTVFVNPAQFNDLHDLKKYPRNMERDLEMLQRAGSDVVFTPASHEMYPEDCETIVETTKLSRILLGRIRPGHFRGVTTIVAKLFNLCQPDRAYFGEKDYQQLLIIRRMTQDIDMPIEIIGEPTVRESDGLAMSSRNIRLPPDERKAATILSKALFHAAKTCSSGPVTAKHLCKTIKDRLKTEPLAHTQSVDIRDAKTLAPLTGKIVRPAAALLAVKFGDILLIDQHMLIPNSF